jgi:hypothetical protein
VVEKEEFFRSLLYEACTPFPSRRLKEIWWAKTAIARLTVPMA